MIFSTSMQLYTSSDSKNDRDAKNTHTKKSKLVGPKNELRLNLTTHVYTTATTTTSRKNKTKQTTTTTTTTTKTARQAGNLSFNA